MGQETECLSIVRKNADLCVSRIKPYPSTDLRGKATCIREENESIVLCVPL